MADLAPPQCSPADMAPLCTPRAYSRWPTSAAEEAEFACSVANSLASRGSECFVCDFAASTASLTTSIAERLPELLACGTAGCGSSLLTTVSPSLLVASTILIALIAAAAGIFRSAIANRSPEAEYEFLLRLIIAWTFCIAFAAGFASDVWRLFAAVLQLASQAGLHTIGNAISPDTPQTACTPAFDGTAEAIRDAVLSVASLALDYTAVVLAIAVNLLPGINPFEVSLGSIANYASMPFLPLFSFIKLFLAFAVATSGGAMAIIYFTALIEALIHSAIAIGGSPVFALLSVFRPTRNATLSAAASLAYAALLLITTGIALALSAVILTTALQFHTDMLIDDEASPAALSRASACRASHPSINLSGAFEQYLCIHSAHQDDLPLTTSDTRRFDFSWLPAALVIILASFVIRAIGRFASAAASELSGYSHASSGTADMILSTSQRAGQLAGGRMSRLFGR